MRLTPEELEAQIRLMAALKMFELGKLSSGKAKEGYTAQDEGFPGSRDLGGCWSIGLS